ncbi:MAG: globin domain-containing protein, partial [Angustibacter sp.]
MTTSHGVAEPALERPSDQTLRQVRATMRRIADRPEELAATFYTTLFEMVPQVRAIFPHDLSPQQVRMTQALVTAVERCEEPDVELYLRQLGARHVQYGVEPEHYQAVGQAMLTAARDLLG